MFYWLWFLNDNLYKQIIQKTPNDWDYSFANKVYDYIKNKSLYITNLSKATQPDARPLSNSVFKEYLFYFKKELDFVNLKIIITF